MNFKRILLMVPAILVPYLLLFTIYIIYTVSPIVEILFFNNGLLLTAVFFLYTFTALCFAIITSVLAVKNQWNCVSLAKTVMIIKLVQVPAYLVIFVLGALLVLGMLTIPIALILAFVDALSIVMTGVLGLAATINASKNYYDKDSFFTICGILQFIFCIDVIASAVLYFKLKKRTSIK